jgi:hypothetical protein
MELIQADAIATEKMASCAIGAKGKHPWENITKGWTAQTPPPPGGGDKNGRQREIGVYGGVIGHRRKIRRDAVDGMWA